MYFKNFLFLFGFSPYLSSFDELSRVMDNINKFNGLCDDEIFSLDGKRGIGHLMNLLTRLTKNFNREQALLEKTFFIWILDNFHAIDREMKQFVEKKIVRSGNRITFFSGQEIIVNSMGEIEVTSAVMPILLQKILCDRYGVENDLKIDLNKRDQSMVSQIYLQVSLPVRLLLDIVEKVFRRNPSVNPRFIIYTLNAA